ncbi:MAG: phosphatidylglycerophosphatase A family protein [Planctomycetota bacterium]
MSKRLKVLAASLLGIGFIPGAPGTYASAIVALIYVAAGGPSGPVAWFVLVALAAAGLWAASDSERTFGSRDPATCVIDEAAGMYLALLAAGAVGPGWSAVAFALFRLFDSAKPFPVRRLEKLGGALGIMCDDLAAGVAAGLLTRLAVYVLVS